MSAINLFKELLSAQERELSAGYNFQTKNEIENYVFTEDVLEQAGIEADTDEGQLARDMQHDMADRLAEIYGVDYE